MSGRILDPRFLLAVSALVLFSAACSAPPDRDASDVAVIGGHPVRPTEPSYASTVGLTTVGELPLVPLCTAVLIDTHVALTAAHCVRNLGTEAYVFFEDRAAPGTGSLLRVVASSQFFGYKLPETGSWLVGVNNYDLGWVRFEGALPEGFRPAKLMTAADGVAVGDRVLLSGYGLTSIGGRASSTLLSVASRVVTATWSELFGGLVHVDTRGTGVCSGDSGGPLFVEKNGEWLMAGIASAVSGPCGNGQALYALSASMLAWVSQTAGVALPGVSDVAPGFGPGAGRHDSFVDFCRDPRLSAAEWRAIYDLNELLRRGDRAQSCEQLRDKLTMPLSAPASAQLQLRSTTWLSLQELPEVRTYLANFFEHAALVQLSDASQAEIQRLLPLLPRFSMAARLDFSCAAINPLSSASDVELDFALIGATLPATSLAVARCRLANAHLLGQKVPELQRLILSTTMTEASTVAVLGSAAQLTHLTELNFWWNGAATAPATAWGPLAALSELTSLTVANTPLGEAGFIGGLTKLRRLQLVKTSLSTLAVVAPLAKLTSLTINGASAGDLTPVAEAQALESLVLLNVPVPSVAPLTRLAQLKTLAITSSPAFDPAPVAGMGTLLDLTLSDVGLTDLAFIGSATQLRRLAVDRNQVVDLSPVASLTSMLTLSASHNLIEDLRPLAGHGKVSTLIVDGNRIRDLAPLATVAKLTTLAASDNLIDDLSPLASLGIKSLTMRRNLVADLSPLAASETLYYPFLEGNPIEGWRWDESRCPTAATVNKGVRQFCLGEAPGMFGISVEGIASDPASGPSDAAPAPSLPLEARGDGTVFLGYC